MRTGKRRRGKIGWEYDAELVLGEGTERNGDQCEARALESLNSSVFFKTTRHMIYGIKAIFLYAACCFWKGEYG